MKAQLPLVLLAPLLFANAHAAGLTKAQEKAAVTIEKALESRFEKVDVLSVKPSQDLPGMYEVFTGDSVSYANATGDIVLVGSVIETATKRNLTTLRVDALNAVDFKALPFDQGIKFVKGDGSRAVAVFSDPDCPYCQDLEKSLAAMDNVTIHVFPYPLAELHPDAPAHARAVWCASDRAAAWRNWMIERKSPETKMCQGDPIDALLTLGKTLRIHSTPMLFSASGKRHAGSMTPAELEKFLSGAPASPATASAAGGGASNAAQ